jgi:hypothetical protein
MPSLRQSPIVGIISGAIGVVLGATLTFCIQVYTNRVEDRRLAQRLRAEHIERMMIATTKIKTDFSAFVLKLTNTAIQARHDLKMPNIEDTYPDLRAATELHVVSALYLPEVEPEAYRVWDTYLRICEQNIRPLLEEAVRDPSQPPRQFDPKTSEQLEKAAVVLERKLVELAKKNRIDQ